MPVNKSISISCAHQKTRANFLLQLGYFRARQRFFALTPALVADGLVYLRERYLDGKPVMLRKPPRHAARSRSIQKGL